MIGDPEGFLRTLLDGAIAAVSPATIVPGFLPARRFLDDVQRLNTQ